MNIRLLLLCIFLSGCVTFPKMECTCKTICRAYGMYGECQGEEKTWCECEPVKEEK